MSIKQAHLRNEIVGESSSRRLPGEEQHGLQYQQRQDRATEREGIIQQDLDSIKFPTNDMSPEKTEQTTQDVLNSDPQSNKVVKRIALIGERNSGTNWITAELTKCFPELDVQPRLVRWKHWFQHDIPQKDGTAHEPTLVIAQFRNVYEWVEAMRM